MKKFSTCFLALLAALLLAAPSFAALPLELNNTQWTFTGIQFNASTPVYANAFTGTVDSNGTYKSGSSYYSYPDNTGSLNGSLTLTGYAGATATKTVFPCSGGASGTCWNSTTGQVDAKGVASPLTLKGWNVDEANSVFNFVPVDGYGAIIGASENATFAGANSSVSTSTNGTTMGVLVSKKVPTAAEIAGAWKVYGISGNSTYAMEYIADMTLSNNGTETSGTGTVRVATRTSGSATWTVGNSVGIIWTKSTAGVINVYNSTTSTTDYLIKNGVADKSKKAIYSAFQDPTEVHAAYSVAIKGDQFTASSLLAGYNMIGIGGNAASNGTMIYGHMDILSGGVVSSTDGNQTYVQYGALANQDLTGDVLGFSQVNLASGALAATNMTFPNVGHFVGSRRTDGKMLVGIYRESNKNLGTLMFIIGTAAEAGPVVTPSTNAQVKNLTGMNFENATASGFGSGTNLSFVASSTAITDTFATNDTTNFPQAAADALFQSMELGDEDVVANFPGAPSGFTRITPAWSPMVFQLPASNSTAANPAYVLISWQIDTVGTGMQYKRVSQMALYKFRASDDGTANQTVNYTLRTASYPGMPVADIANKGDGHYWITDAAYNKTALEGSDYFRPSTKYVVWTVLKDNGAYDSHRAYGQVADPPAGGVSTAATSSSSSGCMFNPMAGFGLEWLLLLLAPALGIIRSRRKD